MNILSIGGGPAGLYFGILRKKSHPKDRVVVLERNRARETFGWGVVFSDETLGYLEENDVESHLAITRSFAHWDAIDVFYRGTRVRSGGHGFSGVARRTLLGLLQDRATELGVEVVFERDLTTEAEVAEASKGFDLVLAADGLRSLVRTTRASAFKPSFDVRKCKYVWLGTKRRFDSFTFIFEENEHGMFQVHAYPFDAEHSTFIVECDEDSWRKAGLDTMPIEAAVAYLERLFAKYLDGERLLTNKSAWINFVTVRNETWHDGNVVLLGDAAHTAHFSIGSGTKMAMEDSIALANALRGHDRLEDALVAYEAERRPVVLRTQKAAQDSLEWFEHTKRYANQTPDEFAFNLLTRSKRVSYANLTLRDAGFVEHVREDFARRVEADLRTEPRTIAPARPPMFTPLELRGMRLENRVVVSPMCMYVAKDGMPDEFHLVHLGSRALGGAALVYTEMTNVTEDGRITPGCTGIWNDAQEAAWKRVTDFCHARSAAKMCLQLGHAGRKGATRVPWEGIDEPLVTGGWPLLSASAIPYKPHSVVPKAMDRNDMDVIVRAYVGATKRAVRAGFDMIEVHAAHGYLLASFLSPVTNVRTDAYGGSVERRLAFPLEVVRAVRAAWPEDRPMSVRISASDWVPSGIDEASVVAIAVALREAGVDVVNVSTGQTTPEEMPVYGRMFQASFSDMVRHHAKVRTIVAGNIQSPDQVNTLLAAGRTDLVALARPHLDDPYFTFHAARAQGVTDLPWPLPYHSVKARQAALP
ncbi:MAG: bifunctional salicylyl-CoA 5-hydroxylase/oxidoreductase [Polyangiaceae bacterium]